MYSKSFICYRYIYNVKIKQSGLGLTPPRCKWPKETVSQRIRTQNTIFIDENDKITRQVLYPKELCYTEVEPNDNVENMIIYLKNAFPDWVEIDIQKIKN